MIEHGHFFRLTGTAKRKPAFDPQEIQDYPEAQGALKS